MLMTTRSLRPMIGLIPSSAQASTSRLSGKQKRASVPSAVRILAIASFPVTFTLSLTVVCSCPSAVTLGTVRPSSGNGTL